MINIKSIFRSCWNWGKRHTFHFIIAIVISIMSFVVITQQIMINSLQNQLNKIPDIIISTQDFVKNIIDQKEKSLENKISIVFESVNARIDTIDSAIKPDKKRRMLIKKIRDAITENINHTIGIRDLNRIANATIDYSHEWNLTIPQVLAQIRVESNFNVNAQSTAIAQGLMQIRPKTLEYISYKIPNPPPKLTPWNIYHNIRAGCFYLAEQIDEFGTYEEGLRAYNWGPDNLARFNAGERKDEPIETLEYVPKVKKYIEIFSKYGLE